MRGALGGPRVLLRRLREVMAEPVSAQDRLDKIVVLIAANMVARRAVVSPHREGGQAQFIDKPVGDAAHPWLSALLQWAHRRLARPITVTELAREAHTSKRTLSRRFTATTGLSPMQWISGLRVKRARDLLETTTLSIEEVAAECGFGSAAVLRHHFRLGVNVSPSTYRGRFHQTAASAVGKLSSRSPRSDRRAR